MSYAVAGGRRLWVDLSTKEIVEEELGPDLMRRWLGGRGLNIEALYRETEAGLDPFSPENPISFSVGPLCGTLAPCSGMVSIASRSPLLDPPSLGSTTMGGHWGAELKYAGYDQLIIKGRAKRPLYLWIDNDRVELRKASPLWGKDTLETTLLIQEELRDRAIQVVCIGPAGERLVRFASITSGFSWEGERLGLGAVMGAKNLKAIAVRGSKPVAIREPKRFIQVSQKVKDKILNDPFARKMSAEGTLFLLNEANLSGLGALQNHARGYAPGMEEEFKNIKRYFFIKESCLSCPIGCGRHVYLERGPFSGIHFGGLSVEKICSLGPRIGSYNWDYLLKLIQLCSLAGLDAVSTGGVISWAMDCFAGGQLSEEETGFPLRWGDMEAALKAIELIQKREGFWELLGEGVRRAAESLGRDTDKRAAQVKGLEEPCFDPRIATGAALSFAVSTSDWDYLKSMSCLESPALVEGYPQILEGVLGVSSINMAELDHKPRLVKFAEERKCVADLLGICSALVARLYPLGISDLVDLIREATGMEVDEEELLRVAERVIALERAYAARDGFGRREETHPERFFKEGVSNGPYRGARLDREGWERALSEYYRSWGWEEETGIPSKDTLEKMGLGEIIDEIERAREDYKR